MAWIRMGVLGAAACISLVISIILAMPLPQLAPMMSAPASTASSAARAGLTPIMVRKPFAPGSKVKVQITGSVLFAFAALIA